MSGEEIERAGEGAFAAGGAFFRGSVARLLSPADELEGEEPLLAGGNAAAAAAASVIWG